MKNGRKQTHQRDPEFTAQDLPECMPIRELVKLSAKEETKWIIENLLRREDQLLISAGPKSGKSLLASEMAIQLARPFSDGEKRCLYAVNERQSGNAMLPGFAINRPSTENGRGWKVLFLALEMRPGETSLRLRQQLGAFGIRTDSTTPDFEKCLDFDFFHVFEFPDHKDQMSGPKRKRLNVVSVRATEKHAPVEIDINRDGFLIRKLIQEVKPEVVFYDTLIQLHSVNENDNIQMGALMYQLKQITSIEEGGKYRHIAHVVLHHTRKENSAYRSALSPEVMRGAGSIHAVTDTVLLARPLDNRNEKVILECHVSSRSANVPNFYLRRTEHLTHVLEEKANFKKPSRMKSRKACFRDAVLSLVSQSGVRGAALHSEKVAKKVEELRRLKDFEFEIPEGPSPITGAVAALLDEGEIEFINDKKGTPPKNWEKARLRLKRHSPRPAKKILRKKGPESPKKRKKK